MSHCVWRYDAACVSCTCCACSGASLDTRLYSFRSGRRLLTAPRASGFAGSSGLASCVRVCTDTTASYLRCLDSLRLLLCLAGSKGRGSPGIYTTCCM
jgi:hypothetical protein